MGQLAVALVLNSGVGTPFGDLRILQVGGAAVSAARRRDARIRDAGRELERERKADGRAGDAPEWKPIELGSAGRGDGSPR